MKPQRSPGARPEARGAVVGRWFLPEWWADTQRPGKQDTSVLRLAQLAAALAAAVLVAVVVLGA